MTSRNNNAPSFKETNDAADDKKTPRKKASPLQRMSLAVMVSTFVAFLFCESKLTTPVVGQHPQRLLCAIFFIAGFLGLPLYLIIKFVVKVERKNYSDFDVVVQEVARGVLSEDQEKGSLKIPLLQGQAPPANVTIHVQSKQHSITTKKTGKAFQTGICAPAIFRLNFAEATNGYSIQGSTVLEASAASNYSKATFNIQNGLIGPIKAYWEETNSSNGLRRVVTGTFGDDFASFEGEWCASDGTRGTLINKVDPLAMA